ncbi:ATP-binding protein [Pedococcus sp. KACC 23699]|uniref:ATP-binding protein n=1 Tax=Pedococcus sp. KACC 23699 TaxID=3149228 RepID=A0AAU7JXM0_9MICO
MTQVAVAVGRDHIVKLIRPTRPFAALVELVSNALDADASTVTITLEKTLLGGVHRVRVADDGEGISFVALRTLFGQLGGSWKTTGNRQTESGRQLLGREGQGRFRAYALGHEVTWTSVADDPTGRVKFAVAGSSASPETFEVSEAEASDEATGCVVECIAGDASMGSLLAEDVRERLANKYAGYLFKHRGVTLTFEGEPIDLDDDGAVEQRVRRRIEIDGEAHPVDVEIVEWSTQVPRSMVLFGADPDAPLVELGPGIHAPGFNFSVAVSTPAFDEDDATLADMGHARFQPIIDGVRSDLRAYFQQRQDKKTRELVDKWKAANVYPYAEEPSDEIDAASRELFNVVAVTASTGIANDAASQKLSLRLLKEALETAPGNLRRVLSDVLDLPASDIDDLAAVLDQTSLSSVIATSRTIMDRLSFLRSLDVLLFDAEIKKTVLERSQLHRMLAAEPWVFGEQYALGVDDKGIAEVLKRHLSHLGRDTANLAHVEIEDRKTAIVDLMLTKTVEDSQRQRHLVVELKRPDCTIGYTERQQIEAYAMAVANDERFRDANTGWDFVLIANRVSRDISKLATKRNQPAGLIHDDPDMDLRIWIKHWGAVLEDRRQALHFAKSHLDLDPGKDEALQALRQKYPQFLPDSVA